MSQADVSPRFDALVARAKRWGLRLAVVVVALVVLYELVNVLISIETTRLWFSSLDAGGVYSRILRTKILLFVLFGAIAAIAGGLAGWAALRSQPLPPHPVVERLTDPPGWRLWLEQHPRVVRRLAQALAILVPAVVIGSRATNGWQKWQLWRHAQTWGVTDPTFHRDISYYVEIYPLHRMVVTLLTSVVMWAFLITVIGAVLNGSLRWKGPGRISRGLTAQLSVVGVGYVLLRAAGYWLDRRALVTSSRSSVTGVSYTDLHATSPGRIVLIVVALLVAALLVANVLLRRVRVLALAVVVVVVAGFVFGSLWPGLVYKLREQPSAASVELTQIAHNQAATLAAFGLKGNLTTSTYGSGDALHGAALTAQAQQGAQLRLLDPNKLTPTFNVKQQLQAYYGFKNTLDVDRYPLEGNSARDVAIAVRELHVGNVSLHSWANTHLVYTHGYGVVAAPTDSLNSSSDVPEFLDAGIPPAQQIPLAQPQVYYGQSSPGYSIVGQPKGSTANVEFDHPSSGGAPAAHTTYTGTGGVSVGSTWRQLLYAAQLRSPSILFSKGVNSASRILTVRDPRTRVAQVAPWLTLDGDVYPAVVDGHIEWIVDGYTTSANYPDSQLTNLRQATTSTLTSNGASIAQPSRNVNYMQNSVKATVDAYTGAVTLYEWNQTAAPDPLLKTWESVFPGLVKPQSDMSAALLAHVRYPQDLFDVQRSLLTRYHVTAPADFYSGSDVWKVPADPTVSANQALNAGTSSSGTSGPTEPSLYMSLAATGMGKASFSLSSPLVTLNKQQLAGYLSVDSEPGPDYGKFTLLQLPASSSTGSPSQVQNDIESDPKISEALTLQRGGNSKVVVGNLLTLPVGGRMLNVEPIYTQAAGSSSFPILRYVVAIYGNGDPAFTSDPSAALRQALASGDNPSS